MSGTKRRLLTAVPVFIVFLMGLYISFELDSDFGRLEVKVVSIRDGDRVLSGLLYQPASATTLSPAVVLAHGICGSKEMMSGIGLELARHGFVALCLDLPGHGGSGGRVEDGARDPSFGISSAVRYLRSQSFVNRSAIGLVGHSLGGGAVRATFSMRRHTVILRGAVVHPTSWAFSAQYLARSHPSWPLSACSISQWFFSTFACSPPTSDSWSSSFGS